MQVHLHQTHQRVADFEGAFTSLASLMQSAHGLHVFPELFLCGYPLQDLCLQRSFIKAYLAMLDEINAFSVRLPENPNLMCLVGGLEYSFDDKDLPLSIRNVVYALTPGKRLERIYTKRLLPNYDIFDEKKYFTAGTESKILSWQHYNIGILICEDMWPSSTHTTDPVNDLKALQEKENTRIDFVVNLSASPYHADKGHKRIARAKEIASTLAAPFVYVNRVGGEDEILFDGQSFCLYPEGKIIHSKSFERDQVMVDIEKNHRPLFSNEQNANLENTWESLFSPNLDGSMRPPRLSAPPPEMLAEILRALQFGLQEYAQKSNFKKFLVALSGGMDSALVLTIAKLSLKEGQSVEAVYMPSSFSRSISYDLSLELCKNLGIPLKSLPIKFLHSTCRTVINDAFGTPLSGLADENIQSRLRGMLIYTRSNQTGAMVINTSNKSEIAVGYSTQYGDSTGAISLLGDLYKTETYALANYINSIHPGLIPEGIITRPPSAELRENQEDVQSLPPYERLDAILEGILSYRMNALDLINAGLPEEEVNRVFHLYRISEYKRFQFCPIIKIKSKSFGFGYRIPISKNSDFYVERRKS